MPITDLQVATLRALLNHEFAKHEELVTELGGDGVRGGYYPLVTAAFGLAVQDRFTDEDAPAASEWLQGVGAMIDTSSAIDPVIAQNLIDWILGNARNEMGFAEQFPQLTMLLGLLVRERQFADEELDAFLQRAREYADRVAAERDS